MIASSVRNLRIELMRLSSKSAVWQILMTCFFMDSFESRMNPRFLAESETVINLLSLECCNVTMDKAEAKTCAKDNIIITFLNNYWFIMYIQVLHDSRVFLLLSAL